MGRCRRWLAEWLYWELVNELAVIAIKVDDEIARAAIRDAEIDRLKARLRDIETPRQIAKPSQPPKPPVHVTRTMDEFRRMTADEDFQ